jgi:Cu/Ag efflux pump CusA
VVVRIFGPESETLRRIAGQAAQVMTKIDGVGGVQVEGQVEEPQVEVKVDLAAADRHGLKPGDVRRQMATVFAGLSVGVLSESQKVYDVVVWGTPKTRHSLSNVKDFLLETPEGGRVRLADLAEVRVAATPVLVQHEAISRSIDVTANVRGASNASVAREVKRRVQELKYPLEYHSVIRGEYAERRSVQRHVLDVAIAVLIGVFLLLQSAFRSWRMAFLAFLMLPFALAGGALAALVASAVVSVGSLVGFLAVLGISARGSIILIKHCQQVERQSGEPFGPGVVMRAARERFAPILMSAGALAMAFLPLALAGSLAGLEIVQPMAAVILGGLITSTFLTLFVVPALYLRLGPTAAGDEASLEQPETTLAA